MKKREVKQEKTFFKAIIEKIEKAGDAEGILSLAVATDSGIDRDGEVINSDGWDFTNFLKNPVIPWAHKYDVPPVAKALELQRDGNRVTFKAEFATKISAFAKEIFELYRDGFLNAFSVGFIPREWHFEDRAGKTVLVYDKAELLEISAVPVPANPRATVLMRGMNISDDLKKEITENIKVPEEGDECEMEDGTMGEMHPDDDGTMTCQPKKAKEDGKAVDEQIRELREKIEQVEKSIAGKAGTDGSDRSGSEKVVPSDEVMAAFIKGDTKRLLQIVDRHVGIALHAYKAAERTARGE
jgi:HK97 family phage prohead protease